MIPTELEQAIRQLEATTDALLAVEYSDLSAIREALNRRADAITMLALISAVGVEGQAPSASIERLAEVLVRGEQATRKLLQTRREATGEWGRLHQMRNGAGAEPTVSAVCVEG